MEEIIKNEWNIQNREAENPLPTSEEGITDREKEEEKPAALSLNLPYAGDKGERILTKLKKYTSNIVNKNKKSVTIRAIYRSKRLGANFNIKDKIKFEHQHNVVYHAECPNKKCESQYTGETRCRMEKRGGEHNGKDKKSHLVKHALKTKHKKVNMDSFKIIGRGFRSNFARKISESLYIKKLKPDLNVQKDSYKLSLFN